MGEWTLFSNHGHVLVCLARDNEARLRNVADAVGITERAVQKIVRELQQAGFISITKHGRCNRYHINTRKTLRHALESRCSVGRLLQVLTAAEKRPLKEPFTESAPGDSAQEVLPQESNRPAPVQKTEPLAVKRAGEAANGKKKRSKKEEKAAASAKPANERQQGSLF